jgi:RNA polymerase sigma-70 factor (ECF subfamily)
MMARTMPPSRASEAEIDALTLARAQAREPLAMRAFVVRYERAVFALLGRLLGQSPHVEDLAQETFLRAFRALPGFDVKGPASVSTWLLTIALHLALDAKKRKVVPVVPLDAAPTPLDPATPETERARRELGRAIERAAAALSDDQRAAFVLVEGTPSSSRAQWTRVALDIGV